MADGWMGGWWMDASPSSAVTRARGLASLDLTQDLGNHGGVNSVKSRDVQN